ncbi:MAG TPA: hypothetical protein PK054_03120 [Anaerohalosphaeraceae bacterium]|nr:hypothetical protein [Anaerohalosphaeraceae bacterium]HOL89254.1 hypothetical protein [Anaerohalosphaeraceae bacterium]HPP55551.1 hypothetical protein [Anaerohalosphaeraceae bacterium]
MSDRNGLKYIRIPAEILYLQELTLDEKVILGAAASFPKKGLRMSNAALGKVINKRPEAVSRILSALQEKNFIRIENGKSRWRRIYIAPKRKVNAPDTMTNSTSTLTKSSSTLRFEAVYFASGRKQNLKENLKEEIKKKGEHKQRSPINNHSFNEIGPAETGPGQNNPIQPSKEQKTADERYSLDQCIQNGNLLGLSEQQSKDFYDYYRNENWTDDKGKPISLTQAMRDWKKKAGNGDNRPGGRVSEISGN